MLSETPRESAGSATDLERAFTFRWNVPQQEIVVMSVLSPTIIGRKQGDSVEICLNGGHEIRRQSAESRSQIAAINSRNKSRGREDRRKSHMEPSANCRGRGSWSRCP